MKPIQFKYFTLLTTFFVTISLCDIVSIYKIVEVGPLIFSGGTFIMPFYYFLSDAITEVYGYQYARQATWVMFFCCILFASFIAFMVALPASSNMIATNFNNYALTHLFRSVFGGTLITVFVATFVNSYILSKWKILLKGKYFWMRSLGSSGLGELIQVTSEVFILYSGVISSTKLIQMIAPTFILHIMLNILIVIPGSFLISVLKNIEGAAASYDNNTSFNPFKFKIEKETKNDKKSSDITD